MSTDFFIFCVNIIFLLNVLLPEFLDRNYISFYCAKQGWLKEIFVGTFKTIINNYFIVIQLFTLIARKFNHLCYFRIYIYNNYIQHKNYNINMVESAKNRSKLDVSNNTCNIIFLVYEFNLSQMTDIETFRLFKHNQCKMLIIASQNVRSFANIYIICLFQFK